MAVVAAAVGDGVSSTTVAVSDVTVAPPLSVRGVERGNRATSTKLLNKAAPPKSATIMSNTSRPDIMSALCSVSGARVTTIAELQNI